MKIRLLTFASALCALSFGCEMHPKAEDRCQGTAEGFGRVAASSRTRAGQSAPTVVFSDTPIEIGPHDEVYAIL